MSHESVTVRNGQVAYHWNAVRKGYEQQALMRQDLSAFEPRVSRAPLTPAGRAWLLNWVRHYRVLSFARRYPPRHPGSYGAAFVTRLSVQWGGHSVQSTWDDTSRAKRQEAAAAALVDWAEAVTGFRKEPPTRPVP